MMETQVRSLSWKDPLEKGMTATPVFLPGESHGQRSLTGYNPWGCRESDTTERLSLSLSLSYIQGLSCACQCRRCRDVCLIPGCGRCPGGKEMERHGNPLQYSCLENSMDRGVWWATYIQGTTKSQTQLITFSRAQLKGTQNQ